MYEYYAARQIIRLLILILMPLLCGVCSGCATTPDRREENETVLLRLTNGLNLSLPADWEVKGGIENLVIYAEVLEENQPLLYMLARRDHDLIPLNTAFLERMRIDPRSYKIYVKSYLQTHLDKEMPANGIDDVAIRLDEHQLIMEAFFTYTDSKRKNWEARVVVIKSGQQSMDRCFLLTFFFKEGLGARFLPQIEQVIASVSVAQ
jgi:hypothetical protein